MSWYEEMQEWLKKDWQKAMSEVQDVMFKKELEIINFRKEKLKKFCRISGYDPNDLSERTLKFLKNITHVFAGDTWWLEYCGNRVTEKYIGTEPLKEKLTYVNMFSGGKTEFHKMPKEWMMDMGVRFPNSPTTSTGFYLMDMSSCKVSTPDPPLDLMEGMALAFSKYYKNVKLVNEKKMKKPTIEFTKMEMQSDTRVERAEFIIARNLHPSHQDRNEWLALYGKSDEAIKLRADGKMYWDEKSESGMRIYYKENEHIAIQDGQKQWIVAVFKSCCENGDVEVLINHKPFRCKTHKPLSDFNK